MRDRAVQPSGVERTFGEGEIIVSKTDPRGVITYANDLFLRVSGYTEAEVIGQPHNLIRHPDMPRAIFRLLWETLQDGRELFGYIVNLASDGAHYWVLAHVTPTFDPTGGIIGFHSNRRTAASAALDQVTALYAQLLAEERRHAGSREAAEASYRLLVQTLAEREQSYDEFVWSIENTYGTESAA